MINIQKYSDFILEEYDVIHDTRSNIIDIPSGKSVIDIIREKAPWYLENINNIVPIYRGMTNGGNRYSRENGSGYSTGRALSIDSSKHKRYARNTSSLYITMMNESEYWKGYPSRSKSIICSTSISTAKSYGDVFRVIPLKENSEFVVCPKSDIFFSFQNMMSELENIGFDGIHTIPDFNDFISTFGVSYDDDNVTREDIWMAMHSFMYELDELEEYDPEYWEFDEFKRGFAEKYINGEINWSDLFEEIEFWMSPEFNNFERIRYNKETRIEEKREVYTGVECLLILESEFNI
jgi:hypothetical protein